MAHTYTSIFLHVVFSTRERRAVIPKDRAAKLYAYLNGIARNLHFELIRAGGTSNHVHLLLSIPPAMAITTAVQKLKSNSSRFMGPRFSWQEGYGVFSVSASQLSVLKRYIADQEEHHRHRTFEEEFVTLLEKSGIAFEPGSVFYNRMPSAGADSALPAMFPSTDVLG